MVVTHCYMKCLIHMTLIHSSWCSDDSWRGLSFIWQRSWTQSVYVGDALLYGMSHSYESHAYDTGVGHTNVSLSHCLMSHSLSHSYDTGTWGTQMSHCLIVSLSHVSFVWHRSWTQSVYVGDAWMVRNAYMHVNDAFIYDMNHCMGTHIHAHMYLYINTSMYIHMCMYVWLCIYVYIYIYT